MRTLMLDYDCRCPRQASSCTCLVELVLPDVRRLRAVCPQLGRAVIYRSSLTGLHVVFPEARLTPAQRDGLLLYSQAHRGYVYFSLFWQDCTLRVEAKRGRPASQPTRVMSV